jgi:hypothetical protein
MPWVEFDPTIPAFERTKTVYALDRSATVTRWSVKRLLIYFQKHTLKLDSISKNYYTVTRSLKAGLSESEIGVHCQPTARRTYFQTLQEYVPIATQWF